MSLQDWEQITLRSEIHSDRLTNLSESWSATNLRFLLTVCIDVTLPEALQFCNLITRPGVQQHLAQGLIL